MLDNSKVFSEVPSEIILTSTDFRYICLSRFVNIMGDQVNEGTATDLSLRTDLDGYCFFASFNLDGKRGTIVLECEKFASYLRDKGFKRPSISEIDKELRDYLSNLLLQEFSKN